MKKSGRRGVLALLLLVGSFLITRTGTANPADSQSAPKVVEVKIDNFSFGPQAITISPGTRVAWTNRDDIPHTVVSTEGVFKSRVLDTDESFSFTFDKAGTFPYFCSVHPKMTGQVIVK